MLSSLNGPQKEAVLDFDNSLLILAGAGSGKTRVITSKIIYALKEKKYYGSQILAVTFTNKAAGEMKERVEKAMGGEVAGLTIKTFHSFGVGLLRYYGNKIGLGSSFNIYDDTDSKTLLKSALNLSNEEAKDYIKEILRQKDRGYTPETVQKNFSLPRLKYYFEEYEKLLLKAQCVDFADLICKSNLLLEQHADVKERINNKYKLILVDEYQDSNGSQFRLLENLVGKNTQLCVVGDDDQSIYRFRGAKVENILNFAQQFPKTRIIKLEENYRSTQSILDIATNCISQNKNRHDKTIFTSSGYGDKPILLKSSTQAIEALKITDIILKDRDYSSTAILYRNNIQSRDFETTFSRNKIPYQLIGALRFFDREEVKDVISILAFLLNPYDVISFERMINKPARGLGDAKIKLIKEQSSNYLSAMRITIEDKLIKGAAGTELNKFYDNCVLTLKMIDNNEPSAEVANYIVNSFGIRDLYVKEKDDTIRKTKIENLSQIVNEIAKARPGRDGLSQFLETARLENNKKEEDSENSVKLMTIHTAKGLEFDRVFIVGLNQSIIPGNDCDEKEEERRILYVAITRARKKLYLSYSKKIFKWGYSTFDTICEFIERLNTNLYIKEEEQRKPAVTVIKKNSSWSKPLTIENVSKVSNIAKIEKKTTKYNFKPGTKVLYDDEECSIKYVNERHGKTVVCLVTKDGRSLLVNPEYSAIKIIK